MFGYAARGLRDAAHILFVPRKWAECEMHILACHESQTVGVRIEFS